MTGFDPFDGHKLNPLEEAARALGGNTVGGYSVKGFILPLDYRRIPGILDDACNSKADAVLCCGQAERGSVTIERVVVNAVGTARQDNYGNVPENDVTGLEDPAAYFSSIEPFVMVEHEKQEGIPVFAGHRAVVFGCSFLIYSILRRIDMLGIPNRATFVHLPPLPQQALEESSPSLTALPLETSLRAVRTIIKSL